MLTEPTHILLVEDNEDDFEATLRSLKRNAVLNPVHWCRNGQDAFDYFHGTGKYSGQGIGAVPALVLLDLNMPGINGWQVLTHMKDDSRLKPIPVVILSTSSDAKDIDQCYAIGANTYIQKPVSFEGLTETIRSMRDYWFHAAKLPSSDVTSRIG